MKKDIIRIKQNNNESENIGWIDGKIIHINKNNETDQHQIIHFLISLQVKSSLYMTYANEYDPVPFHSVIDIYGIIDIYKYYEEDGGLTHYNTPQYINRNINYILHDLQNDHMPTLCNVIMANINNKFPWMATTIQIGHYDIASDGCEITCFDESIPNILINDNSNIKLI